MVEQRSPKPLVACSNRVSPAKKSLGVCAFRLLFIFAALPYPELTRVYTVRTGLFECPAVLLFPPCTSSTRPSGALQVQLKRPLSDFSASGRFDSGIFKEAE